MSQNIDFFPQYTTGVASAAGTAYPSEPFDVSAYQTIQVEVHNQQVTAGVTISGQVQHSSNLNDWDNLGAAIAPGVGLSGLGTFTSPLRYLRLLMTLGGAAGTASFWAKGVAREP